MVIKEHASALSLLSKAGSRVCGRVIKATMSS